MKLAIVLIRKSKETVFLRLSYFPALLDVRELDESRGSDLTIVGLFQIHDFCNLLEVAFAGVLHFA